jgi:16S rRNA (cytosine967-C5)-methyltransferase
MLAVLDLLERTQKSPIPMDLTIGDYMRNRRYIGSKDRTDIVERIYGIVRHHARLNWALEQASVTVPSARIKLLAYLLLVEGKEDPTLYFDGTKYAPPQVTQDEIDVLHRLPKNFDAAPSDVLFECPENYSASLHAYFGKDFDVEMEALCHGATLDLRINSVAGDREKMKESLEKDKVETEMTPYSPWGLRAKGKAFLGETKAFRSGHIEIQDEGSQLIALACDAQPGMQVLDYCAGGGGKTLALASAMRVKGRIVAMDLEEARLAKAKTRFKRAKVSDIIETRPLSDEKSRKWLRRQKQSFDVALVDVPCSGTGTWRRNPDTRWRNYGPAVEEIIPVQADILERVAGVVKPGGRLVYATCSLLPEENEQQIEKFLAVHPEYELANLQDVWPEGCKPPCEGKYMRLTPKRHNTDGFFAAILIRKDDEVSDNSSDEAA